MASRWSNVRDPQRWRWPRPSPAREPRHPEVRRSGQEDQRCPKERARGGRQGRAESPGPGPGRRCADPAKACADCAWRAVPCSPATIVARPQLGFGRSAGSESNESIVGTLRAPDQRECMGAVWSRSVATGQASYGFGTTKVRPGNGAAMAQASGSPNRREAASKRQTRREPGTQSHGTGTRGDVQSAGPPKGRGHDRLGRTTLGPRGSIPRSPAANRHSPASARRKHRGSSHHAPDVRPDRRDHVCRERGTGGSPNRAVATCQIDGNVVTARACQPTK